MHEVTIIRLFDQMPHNFDSTSFSCLIAGRSFFNIYSNWVYLSCTSKPFITATTGVKKTKIGQVMAASPTRNAHTATSPLAIVENNEIESAANLKAPKSFPVDRALSMKSNVFLSIFLIY